MTADASSFATATAARSVEKSPSAARTSARGLSFASGSSDATAVESSPVVVLGVSPVRVRVFSPSLPRLCRPGSDQGCGGERGEGEFVEGAHRAVCVKRLKKTGRRGCAG